MAVRSVLREGTAAGGVLPHRDVPVRLVGHAADRGAAGPAPVSAHPSVLCHVHVRPLPADADADQLLECHVRVPAEQQLSKAQTRNET